MTEILNRMSNLIGENIFGYGKPDGSDYSKYLGNQGKEFYAEIIASGNDATLLECIFCWSLFEVVSIHNVITGSTVEQKKLIDLIRMKAKSQELNEDSIKYNTGLVSELRKEAKNEKLPRRIFSFITYAIFADKEIIANGNEYWKQVNRAIISYVFISRLNFFSGKTWEFPPTHFMMMNGNAVSAFPDFDNFKGPCFKWEDGNLVSEMYQPTKDKSSSIYTSYLPNPAVISLDEICDWAELDYIIKPETNNQTYPRAYMGVSQISIKEAIKKLFWFLFRKQDSSDKDKSLIASNILHGLFSIWSGENLKTELGYFEAQPGIVFCLYELIAYMDKNSIEAVFNIKGSNLLKNEYLRFNALMEGDEMLLPFNIYASEKNKNDFDHKIYELRKGISEPDSKKIEKANEGIQNEKYSLLTMMMFFLFWDFTASFPPENTLSDQELLDFFVEKKDILEKFLLLLLDESWANQPDFNSPERASEKYLSTKWTDASCIEELLSDVIRHCKINGSAKGIGLDIRNTEKKEKKVELYRTLLLNFSCINHRSRENLLNIMDFVGEIKEREKLLCQPDKRKYFDEKGGEEEIERLNYIHDTLKEVDCGFEIDHYLQIPTPELFSMSRRYFFTRKLTTRFFSDTMKKYKYSHDLEGKKKAPVKYFEDYRTTNKNNFHEHSLYVAERNTVRHFTESYFIQSLLDDEYPKNLLYGFLDAKDFLIECMEEKKNSPSEKNIIKYQLDFLNRHLITFARSFKLFDEELSEKNIWDLIYSNDKEIKAAVTEKFHEPIEYEKELGERYLAEVEWMFKLLYCDDKNFIDLYFVNTAVYMTYLGCKLINM